MKLKRTEGSMRTCAIVGRPGRIMAGATSYAMFSIMDFMPTLAAIVGGAMPMGRPIDARRAAEGAGPDPSTSVRRPKGLWAK
jgi:arylsulfatase A-like enzyme